MAQVIIYKNESGGVSLCIPSGEIPIEDVQRKDTPAGSRIIEDTTLPDSEFFNAWELTNDAVSINIDKAKTIAHDKRREARSAEFAPLDIKATIPSEATAAEVARQAVRDKYAAMQTAIDSATTTEQLKAVMP